MARWLIAGAVACVLALAGCAAKKNYIWAHSDKTQQEFYADNSRCMAMGGSVAAPATYQANPGTDPLGQGVVNGLNMGNAAQSNRMRSDIYNQCMMGGGWFLVEQKPRKSK